MGGYILVYCSNGLTNGGRYFDKTELREPIVVVLDYDERWIRTKIDPVELVTLRESGLTYGAIAMRLGTNKDTIWRHLRKAQTGKANYDKSDRKNDSNRDRCGYRDFHSTSKDVAD